MLRLSLSDIDSLPEHELVNLLSDLVAETQTAGESTTRRLRARVRTFEMRYEMSSDELRALLAREPERETADIAEWLGAIGALEAHETALAARESEVAADAA